MIPGENLNFLPVNWRQNLILGVILLFLFNKNIHANVFQLAPSGFAH